MMYLILSPTVLTDKAITLPNLALKLTSMLLEADLVQLVKSRH